MAQEHPQKTNHAIPDGFGFLHSQDSEDTPAHFNVEFLFRSIIFSSLRGPGCRPLFSLFLLLFRRFWNNAAAAFLNFP
jgi:hypothetical protein